MIRIIARFNPRLPRGKATLPSPDYSDNGPFQSTPSAREGDPQSLGHQSATGEVSIHAFREGRRRDLCTIHYLRYRFNPRLPRGKATVNDEHGWRIDKFQSTPSAREGDQMLLLSADVRFQSTPSAREGDEVSICSPIMCPGFNPRLPRGKATYGCMMGTPGTKFQSTPSAREGDIHHPPLLG